MTPREFAINVVRELQEAGYQALWAGGCVRDQLLGLPPKDYDVATDALPDQIRELFGEKRTLPIGAAFGVITVLGPKSAGQIEVATFRKDSGYSDGRHPDSVQFTDAREDAIRRDFTINGMFLDPLTNEVIDFVNGQRDLQKKVVRAIGNPHERIDEDKLRMLRGVRFAATFDFKLELETQTAIREHATEINVVSEERIGAEVVRMLSNPGFYRAMELLLETELLAQIVPCEWQQMERWASQPWQVRMDETNRLQSHRFESIIAILFRDMLIDVEGLERRSKRQNRADYQLQLAWRLTNQQRETIWWLAQTWDELINADTKAWSVVQPLLIRPDARKAIDVAQAIGGPTSGIDFCLQRIEWPAEQLDPAPLIVGQDLINLGIHPGPNFKPILDRLRAAQLDGVVSTVAQATSLATEINAELQQSS